MSLEGPGDEAFAPNLYNQLIAQAGKAHRLVAVQWELTYRCNEKCTHCYLDVLPPNAHAPGELTTEECYRVLDELADLGVLNLTLSGGEILVRRDFFAIAEYARSKKFLLRLFTNGILITPMLADRIAALHPYQVELSLYGATAETHERITLMRRSFELTTRAVRLLIERGVRVQLKSPVMRENVHELDDLRALAKNMGASFRADPTVTPKDSGGLSPLEHRLDYAQLVEYFRKDARIMEWANRQLPTSGRTCSVALNGLALDPYGNVYPCLQIRSKVGNVRATPLKTIWEQSPLWQELGHLNVYEMPICGTCELRNICVRCHGLAKMEQGDLRAPALVNCREAMARRQVLIERGALPEDFPIPAHLRE